MRLGPALVIAAGCGFHSPGEAPLDGPIPDGGVQETWTLASAGDLTKPGSASTGVSVDPRGALTPTAYLYGGLIAHGLQGMKLWERGDTAWSKLSGVTATGAGLWCGESLTEALPLSFLGVTDKTAMTVWFEGEVYLTAGADEVFVLAANDMAFIDLARPGTASYARITENNGTISVATPDTGWYPIRIGFGNSDAGSSFDFKRSVGGDLVPWTRDRMRARASDVSGALRQVFNRQILGGGLNTVAPVASIETGGLLATTTWAQPPQGAAANNDWSARYTGQIYITAPGSYTLAMSSDDGARARLGTSRIQGPEWVRDFGNGAAAANVTADLVAGWNDFYVDYNQVAGAARLAVQASGPDFAGAAVPNDRLRPVEAADDRLAFGGDDAAHPYSDAGGAPATVTLPAYGFPGETVVAVDITAYVDTGRWDLLKVDMEAPGRGRIAVKPAGGADFDGVAQLTITAASPAPLASLVGGPVSGAWKLYAQGGSGTVRMVKLTVHTTGGPEKIARDGAWTSAVLDATSDVFAIDGVTWDERSADGAVIEMAVRSCKMADCSDGEWRTLAKGAQLGVRAGRYLQVRVHMTSDGVHEPELHGLQVVYRRVD